MEWFWVRGTGVLQLPSYPPQAGPSPAGGEGSELCSSGQLQRQVQGLHSLEIKCKISFSLGGPRPFVGSELAAGAGLWGGRSGSHQPRYLMSVPVDEACLSSERCQCQMEPLSVTGPRGPALPCFPAFALWFGPVVQRGALCVGGEGSLGRKRQLTL